MSDRGELSSVGVFLEIKDKLPKEITDRILYCPACFGGGTITNILIGIEDLRNQGDLLRVGSLMKRFNTKNSMFIPVLGKCPVCKKYATASIEIAGTKIPELDRLRPQ
jgi:hypothetical protein